MAAGLGEVLAFKAQADKVEPTQFREQDWPERWEENRKAVFIIV